MVASKDCLPMIGETVLAYSLGERNDKGFIGVREIVTFNGLTDGIWLMESNGNHHPVTDWYRINK